MRSSLHMLVTGYELPHLSSSGAGEVYLCVTAKRRGESMFLGHTLVVQARVLWGHRADSPVPAI